MHQASSPPPPRRLDPYRPRAAMAPKTIFRKLAPEDQVVRLQRRAAELQQKADLKSVMKLLAQHPEHVGLVQKYLKTLMSRASEASTGGPSQGLVAQQSMPAEDVGAQGALPPPAAPLALEDGGLALESGAVPEEEGHTCGARVSCRWRCVWQGGWRQHHQWQPYPNGFGGCLPSGVSAGTWARTHFFCFRRDGRPAGSTTSTSDLPLAPNLVSDSGNR